MSTDELRAQLPELPKGVLMLSPLQSGTDTVYYAEQMRDYAIAAIESHSDAVASAAKELVRLKRVKERMTTTLSPPELIALSQDYVTNKPKAWAALTAALEVSREPE